MNAFSYPHNKYLKCTDKIDPHPLFLPFCHDSLEETPNQALVLKSSVVFFASSDAIIVSI